MSWSEVKKDHPDVSLEGFLSCFVVSSPLLSFLSRMKKRVVFLSNSSFTSFIPGFIPCDFRYLLLPSFILFDFRSCLHSLSLSLFLLHLTLSCCVVVFFVFDLLLSFFSLLHPHLLIIIIILLPSANSSYLIFFLVVISFSFLMCLEFQLRFILCIWCSCIHSFVL